MRTLLSQIIVIILLLIVSFALITFLKPNESREIGRLQAEVENLNLKNAELHELNVRLEKENDQLKLANRFLKTDHRTARIEVLDQKVERGQDGQPPRVLETRIRFTEFNPITNAPVGKPLEFTIAGDIVYVSALVVKFDDIFIEASDPMKNCSLVSFQKLFGENQSPVDGFRIDAEGIIPSVYTSGNENEEASAMEKEIWKNFWEISNSPERQKKFGIRAAHGEAPFQRLEPGRIYNLDLRASGGLTFTVQ